MHIRLFFSFLTILMEIMNYNAKCKVSTSSVPKSVEETMQAVVAYELYRHQKTYGDVSSYERKKIHKDVEFYFNSLPCD